MLYVHAHNLCIFKYILKWIYLSFPNKLIFSYSIVSLINIWLSHSPGNCSKRESSLGMYYMRFSSVRRKMLERDLENFWDLDLVFFCYGWLHLNYANRNKDSTNRVTIFSCPSSSMYSLYLGRSLTDWLTEVKESQNQPTKINQNQPTPT